MGWAAAIGGALGVAQTVLGVQQERRAAGQAHDWSVVDAAQQRAWQEQMSNTAHQREVKDLREAGLNPILSATGGAGAPVGGGATADAPKADSNSAAILSSAIEAKLAESQDKLLGKQSEQAEASARLSTAQARKVDEETKILKPRGTVWDAVNESMKSTARDIKKMNTRPRKDLRKKTKDQTKSKKTNEDYMRGAGRLP